MKKSPTDSHKISPVVKTNIATIALAHQLKSALVAIKWPLKMIVDGDYGAINEQQKAIIEKILLKNEGFLALVSDLLIAEKNKEGEYCYHQDLESLEDIVASVVAFKREEILRKEITISFINESEKIPKVLLDKKMVMLAVSNIVDNAIKYSLPKGEIKIFLGVDKNTIQGKVQDYGIGIAQKDKDKLFGKFFRGVNAIKVDAMGSGLGLFIAKNIIEDHRGTIWFESEENQGSTFYFSLPLH